MARKRKDNTTKLLRQIKKATQQVLSESAIKLMEISKQAVGRPYRKKRRQRP